MDEATKEEVQKLLARQPSVKFRFSSLILKIGAGYAVMAVFTIAALVFSFINLYGINKTAHQIADIDLPQVNALIKMRGSLLAQESFAGKYAILKDTTFIELFRQRKKEFIANLEVLERTDSVREIAALKQLYLDYQMASEHLFAGKSVNRIKLQESALRLQTALDAFYVKRQNMLQSVLQRADDQLASNIRRGIGISCTGLLIALWLVPSVIYRIFSALGKLQKETHRIALGDFNYEPQIPATAEINDLVSDFNQMAAKLKEMEQMNLDALPLARLPGTQAIDRIIDERLKSDTPFAFCHANLDDFKPFRARYGYAKAGKLLRVTGYLIYAAVSKYGAPKDFVGHAGGDDFVLVVSTDKVATVCEAIVKSFDAEVIKHFSPEDRKAGGIERCDLYGVQRFFPITTISLSVIDCSVGEYHSAVEIAGAAADVKDSMKKVPGSRWDRAI